MSARTSKISWTRRHRQRKRIEKLYKKCTLRNWLRSKMFAHSTSANTKSIWWINKNWFEIWRQSKISGLRGLSNRQMWIKHGSFRSIKESRRVNIGERKINNSKEMCWKSWSMQWNSRLSAQLSKSGSHLIRSQTNSLQGQIMVLIRLQKLGQQLIAQWTVLLTKISDRTFPALPVIRLYVQVLVLQVLHS